MQSIPVSGGWRWDEDLLLLLLRRLQNLEGAQEALVHTHHRTRVVELTAVVWRREQRDELALREELIAVFHDLVCTADKIHVVLLQEAGDDIGSEGEADTAVVLAPSGDVLVRVGPEQVAEQAAVGDLHVSVQGRWTENTVYVHQSDA